MSQVNLISQHEYAVHRGVSDAAVSRAIKAKRIVLIDGKIDKAVADMQWAKNTRVRAGQGTPQPHAGAATNTPASAAGQAAEQDANISPGDAPSPGGEGYWSSRSRREAAEAEMSELELGLKRGELIMVAAVESVMGHAMVAMRDHLLNLSARLAPLLAAETDAFKVGQMLEAEHHQALLFLANAKVGATQ